MKRFILFFLIILSGLVILAFHPHQKSKQIEVGGRHGFNTYQEIIDWIENPTEDHIMVVAHRGDWRNAPENSIQAVVNCIEMGVEIVEIDIRMSKDRQLVVIHDLTLDRTTTGKGAIADHTLAEIKQLYLKNGAGGTTAHRVPTLKEMMLAVKDQPVLLNLDKAWSHLPETFEVLRETNTVGQCIFKGNEPYEVMRDLHGDLLDSIIYMPMVWPPDYNIYKRKEDLIKDPIKYTQDYINGLDPLAFEVIYSEEESIIFEAINLMEKSKVAVWVNALWAKLCAGHHDDVAISDPNVHYGWIIEHGANIIQTDRPEFLINYLEAKKLRKENASTTIQDLIDNLKNSHNDEIMVVAHRGDWRNAPENSLQAIQNCIDLGVDMVEIDIRETKDGQLVLMHDETIDRTTKASGYVKDWTLGDLRQLRLVDGLGVETTHRIPTLEEALLLAKDNILINLDKSYSIFDKCYEVMQRTGTLNQVVIKGAKPRVEVEREFGQYLDQVHFMPIIRLPHPNAQTIVDDYLAHRPPVAFEFTVKSDTISMIQYFDDIRAKGAGVWVNALWPHHNGGHDDEKAAIDPKTYDWFIENHIDMIQTDRPELLLNYLRSKDRHR